MPNPTTSKSNDLHQHERASPVDVAEGRRLLAEVTSLPWRTAATDDTCVVDADNEEVCALAVNYCSYDEWPQMEARAALIVFAVNNLPALLRAASENVSLREQVVSANEQRDAAVREAERLKTALKFYSEGFIPRKAMDYAVVVARDMKRRAARGTHPDMPSETCIDTLAAHVTALTTQLEAERAKWADAALQHANNILAKLDTIADLHARLSAETARADKAEAEAKALREAVKSADALLGRILKHGEIAVLDVGSPFATYGGKKPPNKEMWAVPRHMHAEIEELRATLAQPAADGGAT